MYVLVCFYGMSNFRVISIEYVALFNVHLYSVVKPQKFQILIFFKIKIFKGWLEEIPSWNKLVCSLDFLL